MEVVFHISSSWVEIWFLTEIKLPRLPRTELNCRNLYSIIDVDLPCGFVSKIVDFVGFSLLSWFVTIWVESSVVILVTKQGVPSCVHLYCD